MEELRAQGWDEQALADERKEGQRLAEPGLVWDENWLTAQVFIACQWTRLMGLQQVIVEGISTQEIIAALLLHRVPRTQWSEIHAGVRLMVHAALPELNAKD